MKTTLFIFFIMASHFSTFAQIDTSAWEGKTVWVVTDDYQSADYSKFYNDIKKAFSKSWYLTDSIEFVFGTWVKHDLEQIGNDTVVIIWRKSWQKNFTNKNCLLSPNPCDCTIWGLVETFEIRNFQNNNWEKYVFSLYDEERNYYYNLQKLITNSGYKTSYDGKTKIVKNHCWSKEATLLINQKYKNSNLEIIISTENEYLNYQENDAILIYEHNYPKVNYIEIIDLKTSRVIEKIKIE